MSHESHTPQAFLSPGQSIQAFVPISVQSQRQNNIPNWFEHHVLDSIIPPATRSLINLIWITEAFDHFNEGHFELPEHLSQVQPALLREWNNRNKEARECVGALKSNSRKRGAEDMPGPVTKRENNHEPITRESRETSIDNTPPFRKYDAIYTIGEVKYGQVDYYPDLPSSLLLSFGDGDNMRGAFHLGDFSALLFFEKRPLGPSNERVPFVWRGRDQSLRKSYSGYANKGWVQFLEDGTAGGRLDKFHLRFEGRREGDNWSRADYRAKLLWLYWNCWYTPEEEIETTYDSSSSEECDMEE